MYSAFALKYLVPVRYCKCTKSKRPNNRNWNIDSSRSRILEVTEVTGECLCSFQQVTNKDFVVLFLPVAGRILCR
jgi:hypothetical protein